MYACNVEYIRERMQHAHAWEYILAAILLLVTLHTDDLYQKHIHSKLPISQYTGSLQLWKRSDSVSILEMQMFFTHTYTMYIVEIKPPTVLVIKSKCCYTSLQCHANPNIMILFHAQLNHLTCIYMHRQCSIVHV